MSDLRAIAYVSSATSLMTEQQLETLLVEVRGINLQNSITGVLLYSDGNFMQYIEGPERALSITYARIRSSRRHKGIIELLNERIAYRSFPDWQMGFAQPTQSELLALSTSRWQSNADEGPDALDTSPGLTLLRSFWNSLRR